MSSELEKPHYLGHRQRLRERFMQDEGRSMADYELLELLLTAGILRKDVKELSKKLIAFFGSFAKVLNASPDELSARGVPFSAIVYLKAVLAADRKMLWQNLSEKDTPVFVNFDMMLDYCRSSLAHLPIEQFRILFLDAGLKLIRESVMQSGTVDSVVIHPREVVRETLVCGAKSIIMMHNHPGGKCLPSQNDRHITDEIVEALRPLDICVYDHLIFTPDNYFSFRSAGLIQAV